jgi:hypothetical protein
VPPTPNWPITTGNFAALKSFRTSRMKWAMFAAYSAV